MFQDQLGRFSLYGNAHSPSPVIGGQVVRPATVQVALPGLNGYMLSVQGGGTLYAIALGRAGSGGASEVSTYMPGDAVWIASDTQNPYTSLTVIVGRRAPGAPRDLGGSKSLTDKRVSGFVPGSGDLTDQLTNSESREILLPSYGTDLIDGLVAGDWAMLNRLSSGGVGVELFRIWLSAGPLVGLTLFPLQQLARLAGVNFEFMTAGQEDTDRVILDRTEEITRRVFTIDDAKNAAQPQELGVSGRIHSGRQRFYTVPDSTAQAASETDTTEAEGSASTASPESIARPALWHEYIGADGSYTMSTAGGLTLEKYVGVSVPTERFSEREATYEDPRLADPLTVRGEGGGDTDPVELIVTEPELATPLDGVLLAIEMVEARIQRNARSGFDGMPNNWQTGARDPDVFADTLQHGFKEGQWRCLPRTVPMDIGDGKTKKIYIGRAVISVTDDGGILIQDVYNSSITMANGDLTLQAPGNITAIANGKCYMLAGDSAGIQARNDVEVIAADGELALTSGGKPLAINSDGLSLTTVTEGNEDFRIETSGSVKLVGYEIVFKSTVGHIALSSAEPIIWEADEGSGAFGTDVLFDLAGTKAVIGAKLTFFDSVEVHRINYNRLRHIERPSRTESWLDYRYSKFQERTQQIFDASPADLADAGDTYSDNYSEATSGGPGTQTPAFNAEDVVIPEPVWLTYQRLAGTDIRSNATGGFPTGMPTTWQLRRVGNAGSAVDYETGAIDLAAEEFSLSTLETVSFVDEYRFSTEVSGE